MSFEGKLSGRCQIQAIMSLCDKTLITLCTANLMITHKFLLPKFLNTMTWGQGYPSINSYFYG
jgi:hypothetical protein